MKFFPTFVTQHSLPALVTGALERPLAPTIHAARKWNTFRAVRAAPANLAGTGVGSGAVSLKKCPSSIIQFADDFLLQKKTYHVMISC